MPTLAEQYCIVPTDEGFVCNLSPGASVIDASSLGKEVKDALISIGARTLFSGLFPSDVSVPKDLWNYIHRSSRDGVVRTVETSCRRYVGKRSNEFTGTPLDECASVGTRIILYRYLADPSNGSMSKSSCDVLRTFPIFRAYAGNENTKFVAVNSSSWYVLETPLDQKIMTSEFLAYDSLAEMSFLKEIGVRCLSRSDFYRHFLMPSLPKMSESVRSIAVKRILVDLPMLCSNDKDFRAVAMSSRIIPSASSRTLKKASELFDPEITQLRSLMDRDSFPDEDLWTPDLLLAMRSLGLQISLTWEVLIACARSIEEKGSSPVETEKEDAKARGGELLSFVDQNFGKLFHKTESKKKSTLLKRMNAALFEDTEKKKQEAEEQIKRTCILLSLQWVPVLTSPPHPLLPWPDEFTVVPVASPISTIDRESMWLLSSTHRIVDGTIHTQELRDVFGWSNEVSIKDVATQLRKLSATFDRLASALPKTKNEEGDGDVRAIEKKSICRAITAQIPRIYHELDKAKTDYEREVVQSALFGTKWLWIGDRFIASEHAAFSSPINAAPYLYTVPSDLLVYDTLLKTFGVRSSFGSSDFSSVLLQMAKEDADGSKRRLAPQQVELAVNIVQIISDDVMKLNDMEIYAPSIDGRIHPASQMIFDDAPWYARRCFRA